jgi:hypothetical protein
VEINCDHYIRDDRDSFLLSMRRMTKRDYKTFPMVFYLNNFIGGYNDTIKYLTDNNNNNNNNNNKDIENQNNLFNDYF